MKIAKNYLKQVILEETKKVLYKSIKKEAVGGVASLNNPPLTPAALALQKNVNLEENEELPPQTKEADEVNAEAQKTAEILEKEQRLCENCKGRGVVPLQGKNVKCSKCTGHGMSQYGVQKWREEKQLERAKDEAALALKSIKDQLAIDERSGGYLIFDIRKDDELSKHFSDANNSFKLANLEGYLKCKQFVNEWFYKRYKVEEERNQKDADWAAFK